MDTQSVEATGENVEAAISSGLTNLGVGPSDVIVEVLEEGSRGIFGIGAKPARVRLKLLRPPAPPPPAAPPPSTTRKDIDVEDDEYEYEFFASDAPLSEAVGEDGTVGREVLAELLHHMEIRAEIIIRRAEPGQPGESTPWLLDVNGPNVNGLIGRRGETLASLQYITRLIVSRKLQRRANIIVDVGGYKSRRSQRLRELALRMADQAIQQARTVSLEPMPPNERRIVHLTLRNRTDVYTKSTGEGDARKVTIVPK